MSMPKKYTKMERETLSLLIREREASSTESMTRGMYVAITMLPVFLILTYVHIFAGYVYVLILLAFAGIISIGFLFAYLNDRSQERANRHSVEMAHAMGKGINEVMVQNARTTGEENRNLIKAWLVEQVNAQKIETNRQITADKLEANEPVYQDIKIIDTPYDRYEEAY